MVDEMKKTKANISMHDMLQSFPSQIEALLRNLDHIKHTPNTNTQKSITRNVNIIEAMLTMFKDNLAVPPFQVYRSLEKTYTIF